MNAYPNFPGFKATDTSYEAAQAVSGHLGRLQAMTFAAIRRAGLDGLTAHETADELGFDKTAIQPRLSELRRKGRIVDSGRRRDNATSGKRAVVWVAAELAGGA